MLCYTIPTGTLNHMQDNLFRGQVPKLMVMGFVGTDAFNGNAKDDPLKFKHFNVNSISLLRDGEPTPFSHPIQTDFANELVGQAYMSMIQNLEMYNSNVNNGITLKKFMDGCTLFAFNLTPDLSAGGACGQPYQTGNLRLQVKFGAALAESINVIIVVVRDGRVKITKQRQVFKT